MQQEVSCLDGTSYAADLIILGVGVVVNTGLAAAAGLCVENGIRVAAATRTSQEHIYAIGDCTNHYNPHYQRYLRLESVQNAVDQAKVAAAAICGKDVTYDTIPWFWSDQYDVKLQMVGLSNASDKVLVRREVETPNRLSVWYFRENTLQAVDAMNNARAYMLGMKVLKMGVHLDQAKLIDPTVPLKPSELIQPVP